MTGRVGILEVATHCLDGVQERLGTMSPSTPVREFESVDEQFSEIQNLVNRAQKIRRFDSDEDFKGLEESCDQAYQQFEGLRAKSPACQLGKLQRSMDKLEIAVSKLNDCKPGSLDRKVSDCFRRLEKVGLLIGSLEKIGVYTREVRKYQNELNYFEDTVNSYRSTGGDMFPVSSFSDDLY